eukprot:206700-Pyramimonas_sp.AAC.1
MHQSCEHMGTFYALIGEWAQRHLSGGQEEEITLLGKLASFLARACHNCRATHAGEVLVQGLPSGIRAIDLFNTLFNIVLCILADDMISECGFEPMGLREAVAPGDRRFTRAVRMRA